MASPQGNTTRWLLSAVSAATVLSGVVLLFRLPAPGPVPSVPSQLPPVRLSSSRPDELAMRDLAPLFLPTPLNAAPSELRQREPGRSFFERDAERWKFSEAAPHLQLPRTVQLPAGPVEALQDSSRALLQPMGQSDRPLPAIPASGGHVDVFAGSGGDSVLSARLDPSIRLAAPGHDTSSWRPLEFTAAVDAVGLVGSLALTRGSGVQEIDEFFRNYLAHTFRIGDRLPPGFYRIVVGP